MTKYILAILLLTSPAYAQTFETAFSPRQGATALIVKNLDQAKQSIDLAAYSFSSYPITIALKAANDRGVKVRVVVDKSQVKSRMVALLVNSGVSVRINREYAIMHNKYAIIDHKTVQLGSFNYSRAAETRNAENVLVVHDAPFVKSYQVQFDKLYKEAK